VDKADKCDPRASSGSPASGRCVFCSREFDASFLYCPFCGRRLSSPGGEGLKWYYSRHAVVLGLSTLGPFALPLVWLNPRYSLRTKIALTALILVLTVLILCGLWLLSTRLLETMRQLMSPY
jgi:hypothetical protein